MNLNQQKKINQDRNILEFQLEEIMETEEINSHPISNLIFFIYYKENSRGKI